MANKMLIDAAHPEETRVVVLRGNRVEEFDHESLNRRQLRGNIYLAKVTRVEPSLQAAFVDFGGNRHGFLAFSEIHPDYYQIPVADRQALLEEEAAEARRAAGEDDDADDDDETDTLDASGADEEDETSSDDADPVEAAGGNTGESDSEAPEAPHTVPLDSASADAQVSSDVIVESEDAGETATQETASEEAPQDETELSAANAEVSEDQEVIDDEDQDDEDLADDNEDEDDLENGARASADDDVESVGSEDVLEEVPHRIRRRRRTYKIQEVIKRRQIILVQVVKEERGNKGAALTTYLSLAGRYTVLMPNTARGGGISRKITNHTDRRRLRKIANELEVPEGMGLIIRTAGASRTKAEIKRDFEYLLRLWENVRDHTLQSTAPSLVYEEGSLIKRSIRDLYSKEIDEVLVAGDDAYREAKDFMRMLMPSHAKNVQPYKEPDPLFVRHRIERQLNSMFSPYVTLRSGGYIVINQTEALVSIDVNSGKATKEHSIEETALKTNMEAADEIARQLRLRDLAGLIVIDFIDMDERRNNRSVERKMKDCLRNDRARIQIGRISHFGLLEMSRQRLRTGVLEGSTVQCPHCQGTGMMRSTESVSLSVLRALEDALLTGPNTDLAVTTSIEVALYILNQKRPYLKDIEARYNTIIAVNTDENLHGANFTVERISRSHDDSGDSTAVVQMDWAHHEPNAGTPAAENGEGDKKRSRRRRGRGRGRGSNTDDNQRMETADRDDGTVEAFEESSPQGDRENGGRRSRKRGRRGGRRNRTNAAREAAAVSSDQSTISSDAGSQGEYPDESAQQPSPGFEESSTPSVAPEAADTAAPEQSEAASNEAEAEAPKPRRRRSKKADADTGAEEKTQPNEIKPRGRSRKASEAETSDEPKAQPSNGSNGNGSSRSAEPVSETATETAVRTDDPDAKPRRGWWQRRI